MSHGQQVHWPGWTSALVIGILASLALVAAQPAAAAFQEGSKSPDADVRKDGEWTVTRLSGRSLYTRFFDKAHRLFLNPEDHPPELWDTVTGKRIAVLRDAPSQIGALTESPDGKQFLIGGDLDHLSPRAGSNGASARIFIRDARTGSAVRHIDVDVSAAKFADVTDWHIYWGDQNRWFLNFLFRSRFNRASASFHSILGLIDVTTGKVLQMSDLLPIAENLLASPDGTLAIDGNPPYQGVTLRTNILDLDTFKIVTTLDKPRPPRNPTPGHRLRVIIHRAWASDSSKVATVSDDGDIAIWQPRTGKLLGSIDAYPESIGSVHFSPDGRKLLTTSETDKARLWDATNGKPLLTLSGHTAGVKDAVFDSKGERIVTVSDDGTARLWDAGSGKMLRTFVDDRAVTSAESVKHDKQIRTVNDRNVERTWSVSDGTRLSEKAIVHEDGRYGVCFLREGDKYSEIWVGPPGKSPPEPRFKGFVFYPGGRPADQLISPKRSLKGHTGLILALATTRDGKLLASAGQDKTINVWDLERWDRVTGEGRRTLVHGESVQCLAFTPDGKMLISGGEKGTIKFWNVATGAEIKTLKAHTKQLNLYMKGVMGLALTPDGRTLVSGGGDFTVKVWDWKNGTVRRTITTQSPIHALAVSPDGKLLAYDRADGWTQSDVYLPYDIRLVDIATGRETQTLNGGRRSMINQIMFSDHGRTLVSYVSEKTVIFPLVRGMETTTIESRGGGFCAAITQDGRLFVSGDSPNGDFTIRDVAAQKDLCTVPAHPGWIARMVFSPDDKTLYTAAGGTINVWDVEELLRKHEKK